MVRGVARKNRRIYKNRGNEIVSVRNYQPGDLAKPGSQEYEILLWSLDNREDRWWYPNVEPDHFIVVPIVTSIRGPDVNWNPVYGGFCFPWSYRKGFNDSHRARSLNAARREISSQIERVAKKGMHVHHASSSFQDLFLQWLKVLELKIDELGVFDNGELAGLRFQSRELAISWQEFHALHAQLQLVTPEQHRRLHAK